MGLVQDILANRAAAQAAHAQTPPPSIESLVTKATAKATEGNPVPVRGDRSDAEYRAALIRFIAGNP